MRVNTDTSCASMARSRGPPRRAHLFEGWSGQVRLPLCARWHRKPAPDAGHQGDAAGRWSVGESSIEREILTRPAAKARQHIFDYDLRFTRPRFKEAEAMLRRAIPTLVTAARCAPLFTGWGEEADCAQRSGRHGVGPVDKAGCRAAAGDVTDARAARN